MIGTRPTETNTRAYNHNNVASVYISSGYGDLVTQSEIRVGETSVFEKDLFNLQNGVYGMSDPSNLQGNIERFEAELMPGGTSKAMFRIRLINPTDELELFLFGIYNSVFPQDLTSFDIYEEAVKNNKIKETVEAVNDTQDALSTLLKRGLQLPFLYTRWGYGSTPDEGLSRIHKCVVIGCDYSINANQDKVVELHLMDWFASMAENQTFNVRPYLSTINALDNEKQLKEFSKVVTEMIDKYSAVYPGTLTLIDKNSRNLTTLDAIVETLAVERYIEYKKLCNEQTVGSPPNFADFLEKTETSPQSAIKTLEDQIDLDFLPIDDTLEGGRDFSDSTKPLTAANSCWISAYEDVLTFLGMSVDAESSEDTKFSPVPTAFDTELAIPDMQSALGMAYADAKRKVKVNLFQRLGPQQWQIPVWETPEENFPPTILDFASVGALPLATLQPFDTPRAINYNPDAAMIAEQQLQLGSAPYVMGYLTDGKFDSTRTSNLSEYEMTFQDFELIVMGIERLLLEGFIPGVGGSIYHNTPRFNAVPFMTTTAELLQTSQPTFALNPGQFETEFMEAQTATQPNYLLYSPIKAISTVESKIDEDAVIPELRSAGTWQQKGFGYFQKQKRVILNNEWNMTNFNVFANGRRPGVPLDEMTNGMTRKIKLMPSPQAIAQIKKLYIELTAEVLAEAKEDSTPGFWAKTIGVTSKLLESGIDKAFGQDTFAASKGANREDYGIFRDRVDKNIRDISKTYNHTVTVSLGTGKSTTPHITNVMVNVVNGINKLVIGEKSPYVVQQLDLNNFSSDEFAQTFGKGGLLESISDQQENLQKDRPLVLLVVRTDFIEKRIGLLTPVKSFPEITRTEEELEDFIFLTYGEKDSIVTDLRFTGDIRVLYNIPQSFYGTLQYNSLKQFFEEATQEGTENLVKDLMIFTFENKFSEDLEEMENLLPEVRDTGDEETLEKLSQKIQSTKDKLTYIRGVEAFDLSVDREYFDEFPGLVSDYTDDQLKAGNFNVLDARKVVSVLSTKIFREKLFPVKNISNTAPDTENEDKQLRQLDIAYFLRELRSMEKGAMDAKMNFVRESQNEAFQVEISTLGIPELDIMGAEFYKRKVNLEVTSPRGGTQPNGETGYHWLSGTYIIVGIRHVVEPNNGYITTLSLTRNPQSLLSNY